jgi:ATP-binding cassette subfamily B protein
VLDLLWLARPERARIAAGTVCLLFAVAAALAFPQVIRVIIDGAMAPGGPAAGPGVLALLLGLFAIQALASGVRAYLYLSAGERIGMRLRRQLFAGLVEQDLAFFDAARTGDLVSRLTADAALVQSSLSIYISIGLRHVLIALGGTALLFLTSFRLAGMMILIVPPVVLASVGYGRRLAGLSRRVQEELAAAADVAEETFSAVRTVRAFAAEQVHVGRFGQALARSHALAEESARRTAMFTSLGSVAGLFAATAVFWYGARRVGAGEMTAGAMTSFLVYTALVGVSLGSLVNVWSELSKACGAAERILALLAARPPLPLAGGATLSAVRGAIELRDVSFSYPSRRGAPVLDRIRLSIAPGEIVALVGPSGAGKTTVTSLIGRLYEPSAGVILLDGIDVRLLDASWLRRQIGWVPQEPVLFAGSVAENIRYGRPEASDGEVQAAAEAAHAHGFIDRFPGKYRTLVGERGVQLSGGQKQRIAIARAVLKDPRILILDEATSALDAESEHLVREALERLMENRTTLIIAHRLSTVLRAGRVVVLAGGRIAESGAHDALMKQSGLYRRLVDHQLVPRGDQRIES